LRSVARSIVAFMIHVPRPADSTRGNSLGS
jgi:hypothetical protein